MKAKRAVCMQPGFARFPQTFDELRIAMGIQQQESFDFGMQCLTKLQRDILQLIHGRLLSYRATAELLELSRANCCTRADTARNFLRACAKAYEDRYTKAPIEDYFKKQTCVRLRHLGFTTIWGLTADIDAIPILQSVNPTCAYDTHRHGTGYDELCERVGGDLEEVMDALLHLDYSFQRIVTLRYIDGKSAEEVCKETNGTPKTLDSRASIGISKMRHYILRKRVKNGQLEFAELPLIALVGDNVASRMWKEGIRDTSQLLDHLQRGTFLYCFPDCPPTTTSLINTRLLECGITDVRCQNSYSSKNDFNDLIKRIGLPDITYDQIMESLPKLTDNQRTVIEHRYQYGKSFEEIAKLVGVDGDCLYSRCQTGVEALRKILSTT